MIGDSILLHWMLLKELFQDAFCRCEEAPDYPDDIKIASQVSTKPFLASDMVFKICVNTF